MILLSIFLVALLVALPTAATVALVRMDRQAAGRTGSGQRAVHRADWDRAA